MAEPRTLEQLISQSYDADARAFAKELLAVYEARYKGPGSPAEAAEATWENYVDSYLARYGDGDVRKAETRAIQTLRVDLGGTRRDS